MYGLKHRFNKEVAKKETDELRKEISSKKTDGLGHSDSVVAQETLQSNLETADRKRLGAMETIQPQTEVPMKEAIAMEVENSSISASQYDALKREAANHLSNYASFERQANALDRAISTKKIKPQDIDSARRKADQLHRAAAVEKREYNKCVSAMRRALEMNVHDATIDGGLGVSQMKYLRGSRMVSDARNKKSEASSLESKARSLESRGLSGADYQLRATNLRREANRLEKEGRSLMNS